MSQLENTEEPSKKLFDIIKDPKINQTVKKLEDNDRHLTNEDEINEAIVVNLQKKFNINNNADDIQTKGKILKLCNVNIIKQPEISEEKIKSVQRKIKPEFIEIALNNINKNSARGTDNISTKLILNL